MKICAVICEFNPFHNGHKYLLEKARELSGADAVLCIMSGSFTQRGDLCILDKYTRAGHAVAGGADCVIQLPAPFAVAPAEIFAKGAIKILSAVPYVASLAFGCESGDAQSFEKAADFLIDENDGFKIVLAEKLSSGNSYIKSFSAAFEACGGEKNLVSSPNNVLGLEYEKAIKRSGADIKIFPVRRIGGGFNDGELKENFSSASAIRKNINCSGVKKNVPDYVYADLEYAVSDTEFESVLRHCLFKAEAVNLKRIYGCSEGLENKLKSLENQTLDVIIEKATSRRYSSSRIRRILVANALGLYQSDTERFLNDSLYIKPLAVKRERADEILSALAKSLYPVITNPHEDLLKGTALECFKKDINEFALYKNLTHSDKKDYTLII